MAFASLDIPNFRALRNLKVEDLKRVNILVGRNNSGKTSLLEAVELLCWFPNLNWITHRLGDQRGNLKSKDHPFDFVTNFFIKNDEKLVCEINAENYYATEEQNRFSLHRLGFKIIHRETTEGYYPPSTHYFNELSSQEPKAREFTVLSKFKIPLYVDDLSQEYDLDYYGPMKELQPPYQFIRIITSEVNDYFKRQHLHVPLNYGFVKVNYSKDEYFSMFNEIVSSKRKKVVLDCLNGVDDKISDLTIAFEQIRLDIGAEVFYPITHVGEGTNRIVRLLTYILSLPRGGVCLIDEIDTGLHYTALPVMWKAVLQAAESNDVQVFATTHSDECVAALVEVLKEKSAKEGKPLEDADCALYRLFQTETGTKAYRQNADNLDSLMEMGLEYR